MFELVKPVFAHEVYVLSPGQLAAGLSTSTADPLEMLGVFFTPSYLPVTDLDT